MKLAITGATSGIGAETVKALASKFETVFLIVRNEKKADSFINELAKEHSRTKFVVVPCDLSDLSSVAKAANKILTETDSLYALVNNAGGIFPDGKLTVDGIEQTFQINHLGHFLLTHKLMPLLEKTVGARIINVSSEAHRAANPKMDDIKNIGNYKSFPAYANAKLHNILFTKSLVEKYGNKHIASYCLHPGVVKTNFGGDFSGFFKVLIKLAQPFMITAEKGAKTTIYLATAANDSLENGGYFAKSRRTKPSAMANSKSLREKLWVLSQDLTKEYL
jgi:NAD(P)-dependent dehydrogenase (short-subunit alcohol dehydrogenase family)